MSSLLVIPDEVLEGSDRPVHIERVSLIGYGVVEHSSLADLAKMIADRPERVLRMFDHVVGDDEIKLTVRERRQLFPVIDDVNLHEFQGTELRIVPPECRDVKAIHVSDGSSLTRPERLVQGSHLDSLTDQVFVA